MVIFLSGPREHVHFVIVDPFSPS